MTDPWQKIAAWCVEHAPFTAAAIRPPQPVEVLERAQREASGYQWPASLLAFYAWCDGTERTPDGYLWPGFRPLGLLEIIETWRMLMRAWWPDTAPPASTLTHDLDWAFGQQIQDLLADPEVTQLIMSPAGTATHRFLPVLLPIAEDQSGSFLVCDLRWKPRSHFGAIAVFDRVDGYAHDARWRSVTALASATATAMRTGRSVAGSRRLPVTVGGRLRWEVAAPDPLDLPDGVAVELPAGAGWTALPDTELEAIAVPSPHGVHLRYRRRSSASTKE